ncbi:MAG: 50S ribosomal protein L6, partial [Candidatus Omnitrophica bacterium]|nr:50S ribosomal protein L6 [Candidatus Omnitrophota bacterium]
MSRIGKKPITIPNGVKVEVKGKIVSVEGPKGKVDFPLHERISAETKDIQLMVKRMSDTKEDKALHGLYRALLANVMKGVTEGYMKELEIQGVGFKAQVQGNNLNMNLGFSHPVNIAVPDGIKVETPKATFIVIKGIDKEKVGQLAANIR